MGTIPVMPASPNDNKIEEYVIAGLYQHKDVNIEIDGILSREIFSNSLCQTLYICMEDNWKNHRSIDLASMYASAIKLHKQDIFDKREDEINQIINTRTNRANTCQFGKQLFRKRLAIKGRALLKEAHDKLYNCDGTEKLEDIISMIESPAFDILEEINDVRDDRPVSLGDIALEYIEDRLSNPVEIVGIPTPFNKFNRAIGGGMRKGGITLVAGAKKQGKSLFAKEVCLYLSSTIPVLYIDTEMNKKEQLARTLSAISCVHVGNIETGQMNYEQETKVRAAGIKLKSHKFQHKNVAGFTFNEILSVIKRWIFKEVGFNKEGEANDCLVVYDYFKLMSTKELGDLKEYEAIYYNATRLSDMAEYYQIPILAFAQLNRQDQIAQSQRLEWIVKSINYLERKTAEEIAELPKSGNSKLIPGEQRFGHDTLDEGDYINLHVDKSTNTMREGMTYFESKNLMDTSFKSKSKDGKEEDPIF